MNEITVFNYQGAAVAFDPAARMWNLNAMHQAAGGEERKAPAKWLRNQQTQELISALAEEETTPNLSSFIEAREGRSGGTWACPELALAYAHWLDARFYLACNRWMLGQQARARRPAPALRGPRLWDVIWEWAQERYQGTPVSEIALSTRDLREQFDLSPACAGKYLRQLLANLPCVDITRQHGVARRGQPPIALARMECPS